MVVAFALSPMHLYLSVCCSSSFGEAGESAVAFAVASLCCHSERSEESRRTQSAATIGIFSPTPLSVPCRCHCLFLQAKQRTVISTEATPSLIVSSAAKKSLLYLTQVPATTVVICHFFGRPEFFTK
jgi:hypothetical protein